MCSYECGHLSRETSHPLTRFSELSVFQSKVHCCGAKTSDSIHLGPDERGQQGHKKAQKPKAHSLFPGMLPIPPNASPALQDVFRHRLQSRGEKKRERQQPHSVLHWGINFLPFFKTSVISLQFCSLSLYQICLPLVPLVLPWGQDEWHSK